MEEQSPEEAAAGTGSRPEVDTLDSQVEISVGKDTAWDRILQGKLPGGAAPGRRRSGGSQRRRHVWGAWSNASRADWRCREVKWVAGSHGPSWVGKLGLEVEAVWRMI